MIKHFIITINANTNDSSKDRSVSLHIPWKEVKEANFDLLTHIIRENIIALSEEIERDEEVK